MVIPFFALIIIIGAVIWFLASAAKKKSKGEDLGERGTKV
jgi:hypothetical protein